jgi:hypothetical protein
LIAGTLGEETFVKWTSFPWIYILDNAMSNGKFRIAAIGHIPDLNSDVTAKLDRRKGTTAVQAKIVMWLKEKMGFSRAW